MKEKFHDLSKRVAIYFFVILVLIAILIFSHVFYVKICIYLFIAFLASLSIWEYAVLLDKKQIKSKKYFLISFAAIEVLTFCLSDFFKTFEFLPWFVFFLGVAFLFLLYFQKKEDALVGIGTHLFGILYIVIPLTMALRILYPEAQTLTLNGGPIWLIYLVAVTKIADTGGYFGGKFFGKRPIAPTISPNKTIAGTCIGLCSSVILSFIFYVFGKMVSHFSLSLLESILLGLLIGGMGQIGDLAESLLKRSADVKDSNNIPGIGGGLDVLDSLFFTAPILYFYLTLS